MRWIFENIGFLIFLAVGFSIWRRAKKFLQQVNDETERRAATTRPVANYDPEEAERVRKIQEEIRRKIAERRAGGDQRAPDAPPPLAEPPPVFRRGETPPSNLPGEPDRPQGRVFRQPGHRPPVFLPVLQPERGRVDTAQLERQEQLAEQMRVLEESRVLVARRASQLAASVKTEAESERGALRLSRKNLLLELRDPQSLRQAFVMREILGRPVALR